MKTLQTNPEIDKSQIAHSASIMLAIDLDANFKLYSHRCISKEIFIERTNELISQFQHQTK